jgi:zinc protease
LDFDPQEYEKEKRIILEERRLRDTVEKRLSSKYFKLLYGNSLYVERDPIGLVEVIEDSNASIAKSFYDTWYRPESMHLVIVGDFNRTEVDKLVEQSMSSLKAKSQKKQVARVASDFNETQVMFVSDRELSRNSVTMFLTEDISPMRTVADKKMALHKAMILMLINLRRQEQLHTQSKSDGDDDVYGADQ